MAAKRLLGIFFLPPLGIARLGGSDTPLEAFDWETDVGPHGAHRTVIRPALTFEVKRDGSLRAYMPETIRFKDGELLRPVAPFFELWARIQNEHQQIVQQPLSLALLEELGGSLAGVSYSINVANKKAQRRTTSEACGFVAYCEVQGNDHAPKELLAYSPHSPGEEPLVNHDQPIPLGRFQVIKPTSGRALGADLSVLRVRFTPARGEVYGPPKAIAAMASTVPPGFPTNRLEGRMYEIVKAENRILNPSTPWSQYVYDALGQVDPQPSDSYEGAHEGSRCSWGVVDDTCDGLIQADVVVGGQRCSAWTRVFSSCPDYSPDRRHFVSFADDLADRDLPDVADREMTGKRAQEETEAEMADLLSRVFELVSQLNLDSTRNFAIEENESSPYQKNPRGLPEIGEKTMTSQDGPAFANKIGDYTGTSEQVGADTLGVEHDPLPYSQVARAIHAPLTDADSLIETLRTREGIEKLLRPPFGRFHQLRPNPDPLGPPASDHRDPRVMRDTMQDMRMPPYMRDSDENPLSLTWRQYDELIAFINLVRADPGYIGPRRRAIRQLVDQLEARDGRTVAGDESGTT